MRRKPKKAAEGIRTWTWWQDKVLPGLLLNLVTHWQAWLGGAVLLTILVFGPCQRGRRQPPVPGVVAHVDSLSIQPSKTVKHAPRHRAATPAPPPADSIATAHPSLSEVARPVRSSDGWQPPPYAALKMPTFRTHPIQFKLLGDSLIVDVLMEPGSSKEQRWASDAGSRPMMKFEVSSTHPLSKSVKQDEFVQEGQWVVAEKDRAVFVVPKDRVLFKNLRVSPYVGEGDSLRYPAVTGKWMRKSDPRSWYFWLKIDGTGAITKTGWHDDDLPAGSI